MVHLSNTHTHYILVCSSSMSPTEQYDFVAPNFFKFNIITIVHKLYVYINE